MRIDDEVDRSRTRRWFRLRKRWSRRRRRRTRERRSRRRKAQRRGFESGFVFGLGNLGFLGELALFRGIQDQIQ